jgi:uncharacterized cupin superfamily protein
LVNVFAGDWDRGQERPDYTWNTLRIGGEMLGASVYELPPGQKTFPYHLHHANEELLVVLDGEATLRDPGGERRLARGDAVLFQRGPDGAHQLRNETDAPVRLLMISTLVAPEIVEYPDSDKVGVRGPAFRPAIYRRSATLDYFEGEE